MTTFNLSNWINGSRDSHRLSPMIWPVAIGFDSTIVGVGTWIRTPATSIVVTVQHILNHPKKPRYFYAKPLGQTDRVHFLTNPSQIPNSGNPDVVKLNVVDSKETLTLPQNTDDTTSFLAIDGTFGIDPIRSVVNLVDGTALIINHGVTRGNTSQLIADRNGHLANSGASGTGYIGTDGGIYVLIGGNERQFFLSKKLIFSPAMRDRQ